MRQPRCANPACGQPSRRCEVDHIRPFDRSRAAADQTVASNLQHLNKACHQLKTRWGWRYVRDVDTGVTTITTPLGFDYRVPPCRLD
ncbi:MAG: HNH endonuclease [Bifidobacteriaceae bacterium]|nr:HNH endonuclease [Bifidobacteriaceae bacterium]